MKIEEKLVLNSYKLDKESHIKIDNSKCLHCEERYCLFSCPAKLYSLNQHGEIVVEYSGCLECGTCKVICKCGAIQWNYPRGGFGIRYRYG